MRCLSFLSEDWFTFLRSLRTDTDFSLHRDRDEPELQVMHFSLVSVVRPTFIFSTGKTPLICPRLISVVAPMCVAVDGFAQQLCLLRGGRRRGRGNKLKMIPERFFFFVSCVGLTWSDNQFVFISCGDDVLYAKRYWAALLRWFRLIHTIVRTIRLLLRHNCSDMNRIR